MDVDFNEMSWDKIHDYRIAYVLTYPSDEDEYEKWTLYSEIMGSESRIYANDMGEIYYIKLEGEGA